MPVTWSIRHYLFLLMLAIGLPMAFLLAYSLQKNAWQVLLAARDDARRLTEIAAVNVETHITDSRAFLQILSGRQASRKSDPHRCDSFLVDIRHFPRLANIMVVNPDGKIACSSLAFAHLHSPASMNEPWFKEVREAKRFYISKPHIGPVSGKWVVALIEPIKDEKGGLHGQVGHALDLAAYRLLPDSVPLPEGMSLTAVDRDGMVIVRSPKSHEEIGKRYSDIEVLRSIGASGSGSRLIGSGDARRLVAYAHVGETGWRIVGSRSVHDTLEGIRMEIRQDYGGAALLILIGLFAAIGISRRLSMPISDVWKAAEQVANGNLGSRAPIKGPKEIAQVARQFNRMLDVRLEEEAKYRELVDGPEDLITRIDPYGVFIFANHASARIFGLIPEDCIGRSCVEFIHPDDRAAVQCAVSAWRTQGMTAASLESRYASRTGQVHYLLSSISIRRDAAGETIEFSCISRDITERRRYELALIELKDQLRALSLHHETLLESERRRIAREVHDELGQLLTAQAMNITLLDLWFGENNQELRKKTAEMTRITEKTIVTVRHIVTNLRPGVLDLGLVPAIEWLAEDFGYRWEIPCRLDASDRDFTVDDTMATAIFRITQESLTNVARHAHATNVTIVLQYIGDQLYLRVQDDGCGFNPALRHAGTGFGLLGMRERSLMLGASLSIDSAPGRGTSVSITVPTSHASVT